MLKLFKRFEKVAITLVMVVLMITFLMSSGVGRGGSRRNDAVVGHLGGEEIYQSELAQAKAEWQVLREYVQVPDQSLGQMVPLAATPNFLGPLAYRQINDQPELFMLLVHEARKAPLQINTEELETIRQNYYHPPENSDDPDALNDLVVRHALPDLLLVKENFDRIADAVKISGPEREQLLAQAFQLIKLNLIELTADEFAAKAPPPTAAEIHQQFAHFADVTPGEPTPSNPFGFGYRLPDRVKLQYVLIDRSQVEKAVEATKSAYDWDVAARLYWLQHQSDFPTTQPVSAQLGPAAPASQPSGQAATKVRPYEQVKDQALADVRDPMVDKLMLAVQGQVVAMLTADSHAYPTTAPSQGQVQAEMSEVVAAVTAQHHFKIFTTDLTQTYHSQQQLATGAVAGAIADASAGEVPFVQAVMQQAMSYLAPADKSNPPSRSSLMLPSTPLTDFARNVYIFRITDARAAEPAPSVDQAMAQIVADLRTAEGFSLAKVAANGLLASTRTSSLQRVAKSAGKPVQTTDPFNRRDSDPGIADVTMASRSDFLQQGFQLLASYDPARSPHPLGLIELPQDHRIFVAQVVSVTPDWHGTDYSEDYVEVARYLRSQFSQQLKQQWMNYDAAVQRTGYQPVPAKG